MTTDIIKWVPEPGIAHPSQETKHTEVWVDIVIDEGDDLDSEEHALLRNDVEEETEYLMDALRRRYPDITFNSVFVGSQGDA